MTRKNACRVYWNGIVCRGIPIERNVFSDTLSCSPPTCFYFKLPTTGARVWANCNSVPCNSCAWDAPRNSPKRLYNVTSLLWLGAALELKIFPCPRVKSGPCDMCSVTLYERLLTEGWIPWPQSWWWAHARARGGPSSASTDYSRWSWFCSPPVRWRLQSLKQLPLTANALLELQPTWNEL